MSRPYPSRGRGFAQSHGRGGGGRGGSGGYWRGPQQHPKLDRIEYGGSGMIFTMEVADERQGIREAANLIDEFLPKLLQSSNGDAAISDAPKISGDDEGEEKDVSDVLKEMCEQTKKGTVPGQHQVRQLDIGAKFTIFFTVASLTLDELYRLVDMMVDECQKETRCRFLSRCVPIEDVCSAAGDITLSKPIGDLVERHVKLYYANAAEEKLPPTYAVEYKAVEIADHLQIIYKLVATEMEKHAPGSRVNLTEPDIHILINVYRTLALLSCARRYLQRRSFSLRPPVEKTEKKEDKAKSEEGSKSIEEGNDGGTAKMADGEKGDVEAQEDEKLK